MNFITRIRNKFGIKLLLSQWINKRLPLGIELHRDLRGITINDREQSSFASVGVQVWADPKNVNDFGEHLSIVTMIGGDDLEVHNCSIAGLTDALNRINDYGNLVNDTIRHDSLFDKYPQHS